MKMVYAVLRKSDLIEQIYIHFWAQEVGFIKKQQKNPGEHKFFFKRRPVLAVSFIF